MRDGGRWVGAGGRQVCPWMSIRVFTITPFDVSLHTLHIYFLQNKRTRTCYKKDAQCLATQMVLLGLLRDLKAG